MTIASAKSISCANVVLDTCSLSRCSSTRSRDCSHHSMCAHFVCVHLFVGSKVHGLQPFDELVGLGVVLLHGCIGMMPCTYIVILYYVEIDCIIAHTTEPVLSARVRTRVLARTDCRKRTCGRVGGAAASSEVRPSDEGSAECC